MTLEVTPSGVACNLKCLYCYQDPMRDAGNIGEKFDIDAVLKALDSHKCEFTVFGGEPLLTPISILDRLFKHGFDKFGHNGIQTNGTLATEQHLGLFKKYNVHVGISMDGPAELNNGRQAHKKEDTKALTAKSEKLLYTLIKEGRPVSLICTLSKFNAGNEDRLEALRTWFFYLDGLGLRNARLHLLEIDSPEANQYALSEDELITVLQRLETDEQNYRGLRFDLFQETRRLLEGDKSRVTCIWNSCDPCNTMAVVSVGGSGSISNCARTNKRGIPYLKAEGRSNIRQQLLYVLPQEHGGCKDCRFFFACTGGCPGTAIDGDWRNRTRDCAVLFRLLSSAEDRLVSEGKQPASRSERRGQLERDILAPRSVRNHSDSHGDSHGDTPHGDAHGDSGVFKVFQVPVK